MVGGCEEEVEVEEVEEEGRREAAGVPNLSPDRGLLGATERKGVREEGERGAGRVKGTGA